jgi:outer membrane protein assembly factor BamB
MRSEGGRNMAEPLRRIAGWLIVALLIAACQPQAPVEVKPTASALADLAASTSTQPAPTATPDSVRAPLWTFQTEGAIWSSPTVSDEVVYVGSDDHRLYAVNAESGVERWRFDTGGLVRSRPAVADGVVYFASDDGFLYAVSAESGEEVWKVDIGNATVSRGDLTAAYDYAQSSPVAVMGLVYVGGADGTLYVLDAATGQEKWRFEANAKIRSSPAVDAGLVYFGDKTDMLYALDAQTGEEKWRFRGGGDQPTPTHRWHRLCRRAQYASLCAGCSDRSGEMALQL